MVGHYVGAFGQPVEVLMPDRSVGELELEDTDGMGNVTLAYGGHHVVVAGVSPTQYEEL